MDSQVSIVIPTYNRAHVLEHTLPTYLTQEGVGEIIVVDDAGTDLTRAVVETAREQAKVPIHYICHATRKGPSVARNTGSVAVTLPFVLFGEDDVILEENYVSALWAKAVELQADVIASRRIYLRPDETRADGLKRYEQSSNGEFVRSDVLEQDFSISLGCETRVPFVHGVFLTRTDLSRRYAFDEHYRGNFYREETDFQVTVLAWGGRIFLTPAIACFHLPRTQISGGGCHDQYWLVYEYWTIRNNNYFIHKHYATLRAYFGWARSESQVKMDFVRYRWREWIKPKLLFDARETIRPFVPSRLWHFVGRKLPSRRVGR